MPIIRSIMVFGTVSADLFGIGASNINLVRWSIIDILHVTPAVEIYYDLYSTKSTGTIWNGRSTGRSPVGGFGLL